MATPSEDRSLIRRYLLRELDEAAESSLAERALADQAFFEMVELAEDDLVEEYHRGAIAPAERPAVENFLRAPEHMSALRLTRALARQFEPAQSAGGVRPYRRAGTSPDAAKPVARWPTWTPLAAAASLLISCGTAAYLGIQSNRLRTELAAAVGPHSTQLRDLDRRVTQLSQPSPPVLSFVLAPDFSQRSTSGPPTVLELPASADRITLQLDLSTTTASPSYNVTIRRVGGPQIWGEGALRQPNAQPPRLSVVVPAAIMTPDDYLINVSGADGQSFIEYRFRMVHQ